MPKSVPPFSLSKNAPIRICGVIGQLTYGGSERHLTDLFLHLDRQRFAPAVISLRPGGPLAAALQEGGIPCVEAPVLSAPVPFAGLYGALRRLDPQVVCVYTYVDKLWGRLAAALAGVPVILSAYRTVRHPWYERLLLPWTSAVVSNSRALLQDFQSTYSYDRNRLHLLPNGLDLQRFAPADQQGARAALGLEPQALVVAMVARFTKVKGHDLALEAFARVRQREPAARLVLAGHGPLEPQIRQRASVLGLGKAVRFLPPDTDVPTLFAAADAVLLSSRSESLPRVLVEAAACGRPAVATKVGGCGEVIQDGLSGYVVPLADAETMAARLLALLQDPELRWSMGKAARGLALAHHSLPGMTRAFEELCSGLLAAAHPQNVGQGSPGGDID